MDLGSSVGVEKLDKLIHAFENLAKKQKQSVADIQKSRLSK
jgi:hypothetical protein